MLPWTDARLQGACFVCLPFFMCYNGLPDLYWGNLLVPGRVGDTCGTVPYVPVVVAGVYDCGVLPAKDIISFVPLKWLLFREVADCLVPSIERSYYALRFFPESAL